MISRSTGGTSDRQAAQVGRQSRFRPDIEGLRAIAVTLVLLWHADLPMLPAGFIGVDVFFVVSGFLMTGILYREIQRTGSISVVNFYARRARRLIPASTTVIIAVAAATWAVLPSTRWWDTGIEIAASGAYLQNWLLALSSVDYLAQDAAASPLQHFWSLSVEEQYYLVWPLLLIGLGWCVQRLKCRMSTFVGVTLGTIFVASLTWSAIETPESPGVSYFATTTRVWELALGGLAALYLAHVGPRAFKYSAHLIWASLLVIFLTAVLLPPEVPFPGAVALIPTGATAAILVFGGSSQNALYTVLMNSRIVQTLGKLSYSLYLWHWPVLVIGGYIVTDGLRDLTLGEGLVLVGISIIPAALSYGYIEKPFRENRALKSSAGRSMAVAVSGIAISVVAALFLTTALITLEDSANNPVYSSRDNEVSFGAAVVSGGSAPMYLRSGEISPDPVVAAKDNPPVYRDGCHQDFSSTRPVSCEYGNLNSETTIALVGDSHAAHWTDALIYVAQMRDWKLVTFTKSSCPLIEGRVLRQGQPYNECANWNANVVAELDTIKPQVTFVSSIDYEIAGREGDNDAMASALAAAWTGLQHQGTAVTVLRDTPASALNPVDCVAGHRANPTLCATPRAEAFGSRGLAQLNAATRSDATVVDATAYVCPSDPCSPVIGGVMVYRDRTHLTATYSRSLGPVVDRLITDTE